MADLYKIQYANNTLTYPGWNGYVMYESAPAFKTLTLCASEGGTVTASVLTGLPGDTVTLTPTYNTYYRFNNYSITGGTIAGNTFTFGNEDATVQANFKVNYFTATGNFEKGSNVSISKTGSNNGSSNVPAKYALHVSHTGDIPASWYSTSNRWKPNNASAYSITLHPVMKFTVYKTSTGTTCKGQVTAVSLLGTTQTQSQNFTYQGSTTGSNQVLNYNKTFTSNNQNINYGISAKLYARGYQGSYGSYYATTTYVATGTTGTWTATGIAP